MTLRPPTPQAALFLDRPTSVVAYTVDAAGFLTAHDARSIGDAGEGPAASEAASRDGVPPPPLAARNPATNLESNLPDKLPDNLESNLDLLEDELKLSTKPLAVLIDRGTASSAELFAAALHDNKRATLIGEASFGKGLIQRVYPLPNGGALKLTIGEYLRPNKKPVQHGIGLEPDRACVATPAAGTTDTCMQRAARVAGSRAVRPAEGYRPPAAEGGAS